MDWPGPRFCLCRLGGGDEFGARGQVEAAEDGVDVILDRGDGDGEVAGDALVGLAGDDVVGDLALAGRQGGEQGREVADRLDDDYRGADGGTGAEVDDDGGVPAEAGERAQGRPCAGGGRALLQGGDGGGEAVDGLIVEHDNSFRR